VPAREKANEVLETIVAEHYSLMKANEQLCCEISEQAAKAELENFLLRPPLNPVPTALLQSPQGRYC